MITGMKKVLPNPDAVPVQDEKSVPLIKAIGQFAFLWLILGMCYSQLELFYRGHTYVQMTFIGGLAGVLLGLLDRRPTHFNRTMWQQCLWGTLIIVAIEFSSGYLCNVILKMKIWDYSCKKYNILGQICPKATVGWFFICPIAIWMNNFLRFKFFGDKDPGSPLRYYIRLFTLK